jgi:glycosyltransferase involved in cell wall biosynthesis
MTSDAGNALRLLVVTPRFFPLSGGVETHVFEVGRRLARMNVAVTVLTTDRTGELPPADRLDGIEIARVRARPRDADLYFAPAIAPAIARSGAHVVHVQSYHSLVAPVALAGALRARIPTVVTFHSGGHSSAWRERIRGPQTAALAPLLRRAARLIAVSNFEARVFGERLGVGPERFDVVPNGADLPATDVPVEPVPGLIVSVGRLERYKGHHRVIAALPLLLRRVPEARLRIVGSGPYEHELRELARAHGVADRVEIGPVAAADRAGMSAVLHSASVVTLLSEYESHGLAALEAASTGRPIIVAGSTALQELADAGIAVAVAPDSGAGAIAVALEEQIRRPARRTPVALPTWDGCAEQLLSIYRGLA